MSHHEYRAPLSAEEALLQRAHRRVQMKIGLAVHALVFVLVNAGLYAVNSQVGSFRWSVFPLWGWGLGLAIHALVTVIGLSGDGLRERMLASEVQRLREHG